MFEIVRTAFKDNEYCYEVHVWWNMADSKPRGIRAIFLGPPGAGKGTQVAPLRVAGCSHTRKLYSSFVVARETPKKIELMC